MNLRSKIKGYYKGTVFRVSADCGFLFRWYYRFFYKPPKGSIDEFASIYSKSRKPVTVVQIGANDGINNDPIHKFIRRDRWQGVLLEPQRYVFEKFLVPLYRKTRGITVVNAALDTSDGTKPVYKVSVSNSRWATGLTSFNRSVIEEAVRSGYIDHHAKKEGVPLPAGREDYISEEQVECISTETLIRRYDLKKVDWLQIDTEGFDFEIIKMFRLDETRPEVIVYENLHFGDSLKKECLDFLAHKGYLCRNYGPNTLAVRKPAAGFEYLFDS